MRTVLTRAVGLLDCWARLKIGSCSSIAPCPACLVAADAEMLLAASAPDQARGEDRDETLIALRAELRSEIDRADQNYLRACSAESKLERAPAPPSREVTLPLIEDHGFLGCEYPDVCGVDDSECHVDGCGRSRSAHTATPGKRKE